MYLITANKVTKSFPKTVQKGAKKMEMIYMLYRRRCDEIPLGI